MHRRRQRHIIACENGSLGAEQAQAVARGALPPIHRAVEIGEVRIENAVCGERQSYGAARR